jgi:hypothetical protein
VDERNDVLAHFLKNGNRDANIVSVVKSGLNERPVNDAERAKYQDFYALGAAACLRKDLFYYAGRCYTALTGEIAEHVDQILVHPTIWQYYHGQKAKTIKPQRQYRLQWWSLLLRQRIRRSIGW